VPTVGSFEIPVSDLDRAAEFYGRLVGLDLERAVIDGNETALFPDVAEGRGITGALATGDSDVPSRDGTRVSSAVDDIDAVLGRARDLAGRVPYPKTAIGDLGHVAGFEGSEGTRIALSSP